jgi:hypothetical protein
MRRVFICFCCALFAILFTGCWIDSSVSRFGVEGRLIDSEKGTPIAKKKIAVDIDGKTFLRRTNSKGLFKIGPKREYYMTWVLCGPILMEAQFAEISIELDGYQDYGVDLMVENAHGIPYFPYYKVGKSEGEFFFLGDVLMEKAK